MKIIEQSAEFIHEPDPMKLIEAAGRTCYKSEDKITEDSAKRFVKMITKSGHYSVLEHGNISFNLKRKKLWDYLYKLPHAKYLKFSANRLYIISGNFRAWLEFFQTEHIEAVGWPNQTLHKLAYYLHQCYSSEFNIERAE